MKPERLEEIRQHAKYRTLVTFNTQAIDELLAEVDRLTAMVPKWKPIESATKDGSEMLLLSYDQDCVPPWPYMYTGRWCKEGPGKGAFRCLEYDAFDREPTHWMPLPETPGEVE